MKNFIQIGDKQISLEPQTQEEWHATNNACFNILARMVVGGTSHIKEDKKRIESIITVSSQWAASIAKIAFMVIADEKKEASEKSKKEHQEEVAEDDKEVSEKDYA